VLQAAGIKTRRQEQYIQTAYTESITLQCGIVPGEFLTPFLFQIGLIPPEAPITQTLVTNTVRIS